MLRFFSSDLWNEMTVCRAGGLEVTSSVPKASTQSSVQHTGTTFMISLKYPQAAEALLGWFALFSF